MAPATIRDVAKKAGVALAYKAISEKNKVGTIIFGDEVKTFLEPTLDFQRIIETLTIIRAKSETDFAKTIEKSVELFGRTKETKHLILLTDAMPTSGKTPKKDTLNAVGMAREAGITISIIGIDLDEEGLELANKIIEISEGRLYKVKDLDEVDLVILEDYHSL